MMKKISMAAAGLAVAATASFAGGHAGPLDAAVGARQAQMQLYAFNLGILGGMAQGKTEYDAAAATAAANNLAALTSLDQSAMWPQGSDSDALEASRALPAMWENFPDVIAKGTALAEAAAAMAGAAGNGVEGIQANIGAVGGTCGACHKAYRTPNS